jgi:HK97 family phage prohead protease
VLALYSHELERLLGRESAGTLRLKQDDKGLAVEIDLPDTSDGRDVGVLIQRGDLKGMSFGFSVTKQEWDETVTPPKRTIMAVELYEVTITADPAYPDTRSAWPSWRKRASEARRAQRASRLRRGHHRSRTQSPNTNSAASRLIASRASAARAQRTGPLRRAFLLE